MPKRFLLPSLVLLLLWVELIVGMPQAHAQAAPGPPGSGPGSAPGATPPDRGPVPEPATAALIGIGALGVYGYKKLFMDKKTPPTP